MEHTVQAAADSAPFRSSCEPVVTWLTKWCRLLSCSYVITSVDRTEHWSGMPALRCLIIRKPFVNWCTGSEVQWPAKHGGYSTYHMIWHEVNSTFYRYSAFVRFRMIFIVYTDYFHQRNRLFLVMYMYCVFCEILTAFENLFRPISGLGGLKKSNI